ncbi:MAG TPA: vanadium-dependent haloperoxidase [Gemmatimonadaceae bacterium]|nr:vanadium-dependent haloperoxidase [Gemmatimonadaceae bacterium]
MRTRILLALVTSIATAGCGGGFPGRQPPPSDADMLHAAVGQLSSVIVYDIFSPPQASRAYAYASIAAYEAVRPGNPAYATLAGQVNGLTAVPAPDSGVQYSLPLAGVHAFMTVGHALTFSRARMDSLRAEAHEQFRRSGVPEPVFARSVAYGERVAQHILAWAGRDRFKESRGYPKFTVTSIPGRWTPTPPAYMDAVEPNWAMLRPFVLDTSSQFRPEPPFPFDTAQGSPFFREVREVYETSRRLTPEQRELTAFWDCNPYVMHVQGHTMFATKKITPGGHWMGIVGIAARKSGADVVESAAAYARTAVALADGFISSWDEKYRSGVVRPETVINVYVDEAWQPLLQTPPFPEYTSGHSVISTAAAAVLTDQFGDGFAFADSTELEYGLPVRSFASFEQAAAEAAISRLYGGIHYRRAIEQGTAQGRKVGALVVRRLRTRADRPVVAARGRADGAPRAVAAAPRP